jgi:hypothetical protein
VEKVDVQLAETNGDGLSERRFWMKISMHLVFSAIFFLNYGLTC